ncbi:hypothetical protein ACQKQA_18515 [Pseudomonas sp. NPDC089530]|uniref:hypothetical protein n=1 Tax=Pseudomonas sp. NPDC089530 TaxID=3390651 RepID=UPI003CFEE4EA
MDKARCIVESGYEVNTSDEDWLGSGVYFFVDGFACPKSNAKEWALFKYHGCNPCVVASEVLVSPEKVLDLRDASGLYIYNEARARILSENYESLLKRRDLSKKKRRDIRLDDAIVTRKVVSLLNVSVLFHNLYIKNKIHRGLELESSYPNSTVCCVADPNLIVRSWVVERY